MTSAAPRRSVATTGWTAGFRSTATTSRTSCAATAAPPDTAAATFTATCSRSAATTTRASSAAGRAKASGHPESAITALDVLHADASNPVATIVGDLATGAAIPEDRFDCVICTQTLHVIYEVEAAIATLQRMLKPGGVALVTIPGITQTCRPDRDLWGDYWRFTTLSARRLFETAFAPEDVRVEAYGNVLASIAFLEGLAAAELRREELEPRDPDYEMLITVRAQRGLGG